MQEKHQDVAVACYVSGRHFGRRRKFLRVVVVGTLVHAQGPYEEVDGTSRDGWAEHFHSLNVYAEHNEVLYALHIADNEAYAACESAAIDHLRYHGELPDADHDFAMQYG